MASIIIEDDVVEAVQLKHPVPNIEETKKIIEEHDRAKALCEAQKLRGPCEGRIEFIKAIKKLSIAGGNAQIRKPKIDAEKLAAAEAELMFFKDERIKEKEEQDERELDEIFPSCEKYTLEDMHRMDAYTERLRALKINNKMPN